MELIRRTAALAQGRTDGELNRSCRAGQLTRIRPGIYASGAGFDALSAHERHIVQVTAAAHAHGDEAVISHISAAALHGLPLWNVDLRRVHVTRSTSKGGRVSARRHLHNAKLADSDVTSIDGVRVTTLQRTVADICRTVPFEEAVVIGDAALRADSTIDPAASLARMRNWPGSPAARRVAAFLDGDSESVGESRSRVLLDRIGLPAPELQRRVFSGDGILLGRADFCLPNEGVLGEFDGRLKYGRLLREGQSAGDAVHAEKRREDALRDAGWEVVRWTWADLYEPERLRRRFDRAIARGRPMT